MDQAPVSSSHCSFPHFVVHVLNVIPFLVNGNLQNAPEPHFVGT